MRPIVLAVLLAASATAQTPEEDFQIYSESPRLLARQQRLRLLRRERERQSPRWRQFELLLQGKAPFPEAGFALALYHLTAGDDAVGRAAVAAALQPSASVRDAAIVYDWCGQLLTATERATLETRLRQAARAPVQDFASARNVAFAALAAGESAPLRALVQEWWRSRYAKDLNAGTRVMAHTDVYPMAELFHVIRDNFQIDLREDILPVFKDLPLQRLLSYYPAAYPAAENEYRIPWYSGKGDPDLTVAAMSRIAEMSLVAYDNNAQEMQFLQGWLMHDRFVLRSPLGAPYEFFWANPYQPGLPYEKMPLHFHDQRAGSLMVRSSWEENATWAGIFGRTMQIFRDGRILPLSLKQPLVLGETSIAGGGADLRFRVAERGPRRWFLVGLKPSSVFDVEVDDEDMTEATTDRGGILALEFARLANQWVRVREWKQPPLQAQE